ncbi:hypothetical protein [Lederbergia galactosidilytica]|nr:hypothetical protein [Lederbergia galactosidilytica]
MEDPINKTIIDLSEYIQRIIEDGSSEERQLLPELVNSLARLIES